MTDTHTHIHIHFDQPVDPRPDAILAGIAIIQQEQKRMSAEMDALTAQVEATHGAVESAITLINGIAARIAAAGTDPAALSALTSDLKAETDALAEAVAANTPAP